MPIETPDSPPPGENQDYYFDDFMEQVDKGRRGENQWIPYPLDRWSWRIGSKKRMYHLIGGDSGTGKSAFVDLVYILRAYEWYKQDTDTNIDLEIYLRSMERSKEFRVAKWVCWKLFMDYGILIDVKSVLGWVPSDDPLGQPIYDKIQKCREYFTKMQDEVLTIIDGPQNPTGIQKHIKYIASQNGTRQKKSDYDRGGYIPDNEDKLVIYILDHIGCLRRERGFTEKDNLDKATEYLQTARDRYGFMTVVVNQFNRSLSDAQRRSDLTAIPEKQDFKGSSNMYEDCDCAIALFNPDEYGIKKSAGYNIPSFVSPEGYNRYRSAHLLKSTYGGDNINLGLNFVGECGHFEVLPPPGEMAQKDYELAASLNHYRRDASSKGYSISTSGS